MPAHRARVTQRFQLEFAACIFFTELDNDSEEWHTFTVKHRKSTYLVPQIKTTADKNKNTFSSGFTLWSTKRWCDSNHREKKISRRITGSYSLCSNQSEIKESQSSQTRLSSYYGCRVQVKVDLCLCSCIFSPPFLSIHKHELMGGSFHACPDLWLPTPGLGFNRSDV